MRPDEVYNALKEEFHPELCTEVFPVIGLYEENAKEINRVFTATFASDEVFQKLEERRVESCMLFTHHPAGQRKSLLNPAPPVSEYAKEVMRNRHITLFSYHIPLDRNGPYSPGNNLAKRIGASPYDEFYLQNQVKMGVLCNTKYGTAEEIEGALKRVLGHPVKRYAYGTDRLCQGRIAIMAGGAKNKEIYRELREKGVNTLVTGVTNPSVFWTQEIHEQARSEQINLIGGTHYSTERFAPEEMVFFFQKLGLPAEFISETPVMTEL